METVRQVLDGEIINVQYNKNTANNTQSKFPYD